MRNTVYFLFAIACGVSIMRALVVPRLNPREVKNLVLTKEIRVEPEFLKQTDNDLYASTYIEDLSEDLASSISSDTTFSSVAKKLRAESIEVQQPRLALK